MRYLVRHRRSRPMCRVDSTRPLIQTVGMATTGSDRLARVVSARRGDLDLTQEEFAARGGVTARTVQRVENAEPLRRSTLSKIDRAAGWRSGSAQAVLDGGDPTMAHEPATSSAAVERNATYLLAIWRVDGRDAMIAEFKELSGEIGKPEAKAALRRAVEMGAEDSTVTRMTQ